MPILVTLTSREIHSQEISRVLGENKIPIVAGFQGVTRNGELTTLGRELDVTAVPLHPN